MGPELSFGTNPPERGISAPWDLREVPAPPWNSRGSQHRLLRAGAEDGPRECHENGRREDDDSGSAAGNHAGMAGAGGRRPRALPLEFRAHLGETRENLQPEQQKCLGITQFIPVYSKIPGGKIFEYLFI